MQVKALDLLMEEAKQQGYRTFWTEAFVPRRHATMFDLRMDVFGVRHVKLVRNLSSPYVWIGIECPKVYWSDSQFGGVWNEIGSLAEPGFIDLFNKTLEELLL